jgi:hypothetical protein
VRKVFYYLYVSGLLLLPLVLIILPADFFDSGQSVCVSVLLFDQECYGCGMTRGIQHLLHLDFLTAYEFNKLSLIVLPLLVYLWFNELRKIKKLIKNVP